jgi:hypothetical protein
MKCARLLVGTVFTASVMLVCVGPAFAGVVIAETSMQQSPVGETSQKRTIYVQGNKQKVESEGTDTITDLDNSVIYVIDKNHRSYAELSLKALHPLRPPEARNGVLNLSKTGNTRVIANHSCNEYRGSAGNSAVNTTISAWVSHNPHGADQVTAFEHKMLSRRSGRAIPQSAKGEAADLVLEKQSSVNFRIPDVSGRNAYRTAFLLARTEISDIQLKTLPADTFEPPKGFSKLQRRLPENIPEDTPHVPDGSSIEAIAPDSSHSCNSAQA